jgi:acetyl-CoA carboxylase biotin carboxyl carrier protein
VSLTYDEIAEIIKLIDSSSCDELVVETGDIKLVVRRNGTSAGATAEYVERGSAPVTVSPAAPRKARAAAPKVAAAGDALCMIEVMKLFTTINAEVAGRIVQIGAENGELVEYGRTLFVIEPS